MTAVPFNDTTVSTDLAHRQEQARGWFYANRLEATLLGIGFLFSAFAMLYALI